MAVREDRHVLTVEVCSEVRALHKILEEIRLALLRFVVDNGHRDEDQEVVVVPDAHGDELPLVLLLEER